MKIFLVRHGETAGNVSQRHQTNTIELTAKGKEQAQAVAIKLKELAPTKLVCSPLTRALETAQAIGAECNLPIEVNEVFAEINRPDSFHGRHRKGLYSLLFYIRWFFEFKSVAHDGGESYEALRLRITKAQEVLKTYPADGRIVVVSHAVFINFFLVHMCNTQSLSLLQVLRCARAILNLPNGAVVALDFDSTKNVCPWQVENLT